MKSDTVSTFSLFICHEVLGLDAMIFIFLSSRINTDSDYSHEIKRHLLLGRNAVINLDNVLKGRDINLPTNVHIVKAMVFVVVMYGCESWTIKKAEC